MILDGLLAHDFHSDDDPVPRQPARLDDIGIPAAPDGPRMREKLVLSFLGGRMTRTGLGLSPVGLMVMLMMMVIAMVREERGEMPHVRCGMG